MAVMTFSCTKETASIQQETPSGKLLSGVTTQFSATTGDAVKTYIGSYESQVGQILWSDTDKIFVNGRSSYDETRSEDNTKLSFAVDSIESPYCALSPYRTGSKYDAENKTVRITVSGTGAPQYHEYSDVTTYAAQVGFMAAYSTDGNLSFQHLMTYLKITIQGGEDQDSISRVYVRSNDSEKPNIAGYWTVDFKTTPFGLTPGTLTSVIKYDCVKDEHTGLKQGTPLMIAIPAYNYDKGLIITVKDVNDHFQSYIIPAESSNYSEKRGVIIEKTLAFSPKAASINSAADWELFAKALNSGNDEDLYRFVGDGSTTVKIGQDFTAAKLTKIKNLSGYSIDGNGKTITLSAAENPLFGSIASEVKDLTIAGTMTTTTSTESSFADSLKAGGSMVNCVNKMNITVSNSSDYIILGGLVRIISGGSMTNCSNEGNLTANITFSDGNRNLQVGGIAAQTNKIEKDSTVTLTNCTNKGKITVNPISTSNSNVIEYNAVGGIIAWLRHSEATLVLNGCSNTGDIEYTGTGLTGSGYYAGKSACCVGGIIGTGSATSTTSLSYKASDMTTELNNCKNSGTLHNCFANYSATSESTNKVYTGGIAGSLFGDENKSAKLIGCKNTGTILPYDLTGDSSSSRPGYCQVTGGLIGFGGYVQMDKDTVDCQIGNGKRPTAAYGSVIGFTIKPFTMTNSIIWTEGWWTRFSGYKSNRATGFTVPVKYNNTAMGVAPNINGSSISNSTFGINMHTSTDCASTTDKTDQSSKLTTTLNWEGDENCVCGQKYESLSSDVTFTNVTYVTTKPTL